MNNLKTVVLMAAISGLLIVLGGAIGGLSGAFVFLLIAAAMNFASYWYSASMVLRLSGAHEIERAQDPALFALVGEVAERSGMPMPRVYVIDSPQANAFATGRNPQHAAVAVTTGIRGLLTERELRGVLGHEMAHVSNRDILTSSIVATVASAISMIAWSMMWFGGGRRDDRDNGALMLVAAIVAPIAATVIQLAISRSREFEADHDGARFVQDPEALASALGKLERGAQAHPVAVRESTAHLYIVNPLHGARMGSLFSTHPPIEERVRRLHAMTGTAGR